MKSKTIKNPEIVERLSALKHDAVKKGAIEADVTALETAVSEEVREEIKAIEKQTEIENLQKEALTILSEILLFWDRIFKW